MFRKNTASAGALIAAFGLATFAIACGDKNITTFTNVVVVPANHFSQTNLVSDIAGYNAATLDPLLVNPWGITFDPSGALWVANAGSGTATSYDANGVKLTPFVSIPAAGTPIITPANTIPIGSPTGIVRNATSDFTIPGHGVASYIFASEDGAISAWESTMGSAAQLVADRSSDTAIYKGLAMANDAGANRLYATNFFRNRIDVFDASFALIGTFTDSTMPAGYAPFGIANIGGNLWVTYAKQHAPDNHDDEAGVGNGFVDVFTPSGAIVRRFATGGALNSPWAITQAPTGFGPFAGAVLIGNFGDGTIGAYDANSGALLDLLRDPSGNTISIQGLWGLVFGPSATSTSLYFSAGVGGEAHGLVGRLSP